MLSSASIAEDNPAAWSWEVQVFFNHQTNQTTIKQLEIADSIQIVEAAELRKIHLDSSNLTALHLIKNNGYGNLLTSVEIKNMGIVIPEMVDGVFVNGLNLFTNRTLTNATVKLSRRIAIITNWSGARYFDYDQSFQYDEDRLFRHYLNRRFQVELYFCPNIDLIYGETGRLYNIAPPGIGFNGSFQYYPLKWLGLGISFGYIFYPIGFSEVLGHYPLNVFCTLNIPNKRTLSFFRIGGGFVFPLNSLYGANTEQPADPGWFAKIGTEKVLSENFSFHFDLYYSQLLYHDNEGGYYQSDTYGIGEITFLIGVGYKFK
jgi:hypothetical protein